MIKTVCDRCGNDALKDVIATGARQVIPATRGVIYSKEYDICAGCLTDFHRDFMKKPLKQS